MPGPSGGMVFTLSELIAEWRQRLRACREALHAAGDDHASAQYLQMHERILRYLLGRYDGIPPSPSPPPLPRRRRRWAPPLLPEIEPSPFYPPRNRAEVRRQLLAIRRALHSVPTRRPWLFRRRPGTRWRL